MKFLHQCAKDSEPCFSWPMTDDIDDVHASIKLDAFKRSSAFCAANMRQICGKYAANMRQICGKYAANTRQICANPLANQRLARQ